MDFVDEGQSAELVGDVAQVFQRTDGAGHRVHRFEGDDLGHAGIDFAQQLPQMQRIVVAENVPRDSAVLDALDHGRVITGVREDLTARKSLGQGEQRRIVGYETRGEHQTRFLLVQVGQFHFQRFVQEGVAGNVARSARTRSVLIQRCPKTNIYFNFITITFLNH